MLFDVRLVGLNRKIVFKELDFCVMTNLKFVSLINRAKLNINVLLKE